MTRAQNLNLVSIPIELDRVMQYTAVEVIYARSDEFDEPAFEPANTDLLPALELVVQ